MNSLSIVLEHRSNFDLNWNRGNAKQETLLRDASKGWVFNAATGVAEAGHGSVVRPSGELLLHSLRQDGPIDI